MSSLPDGDGGAAEVLQFRLRPATSSTRRTTPNMEYTAWCAVVPLRLVTGLPFRILFRRWTSCIDWTYALDSVANMITYVDTATWQFVTRLVVF